MIVVELLHDVPSTQVHTKIQTEDHDQLTTIIKNKIIVLAWEMEFLKFESPPKHNLRANFRLYRESSQIHTIRARNSSRFMWARLSIWVGMIQSQAFPVAE